MTLTRKQIDRQDFVDNEIFELINTLVPKSKRIDWDIKIIGNIRDVVYEEISKKVTGVHERRFYP